MTIESHEAPNGKKAPASIHADDPQAGMIRSALGDALDYLAEDIPTSIVQVTGLLHGQDPDGLLTALSELSSHADAARRYVSDAKQWIESASDGEKEAAEGIEERAEVRPPQRLVPAFCDADRDMLREASDELVQLTAGVTDPDTDTFDGLRYMAGFIAWVRHRLGGAS